MVGVGRSGFVIGGCCCERGDRSRRGLGSEWCEEDLIACDC